LERWGQTVAEDAPAKVIGANDCYADSARCEISLIHGNLAGPTDTCGGADPTRQNGDWKIAAKRR
jgi:hypothetical protein